MIDKIAFPSSRQNIHTLYSDETTRWPDYTVPYNIRVYASILPHDSIAHIQGSWRNRKGLNNSSCITSSSSSSSSCIFHGVGPLFNTFRSHVSRSLFKDLPWFLLPGREQYFIILDNLFTCCIQLLLYSSNSSCITTREIRFLEVQVG